MVLCGDCTALFCGLRHIMCFLAQLCHDTSMVQGYPDFGVRTNRPRPLAMVRVGMGWRSMAQTTDVYRLN